MASPPRHGNVGASWKRPRAVWRVSVDPDSYLASSSGRQAAWSAFSTINLAVMGSSILPMPYVLSRTGVLVGLAAMLAVAVCNDYTTMLMIDAAYATGLDSYEALAGWVGGRQWKAVTRAVLIALLWGPNSGGLSQIGDVAQAMIDGLRDSASSGGGGGVSGGPAAAPGAAPAGGSGSGGSAARALAALPPWLANGQAAMVVITLLLVFPLSVRKHMRSLESAAAAGLAVLAALLAVLAAGALAAGLPALADGQLALWSLKVTDELPEAVSILGYAFYLQPLCMPILREMPAGRSGRQAITAAVHFSLLGSCLLLYAGTGFFGAALFGSSTRSNIMLNPLAASPLGGWPLNALMLLYLAAGAAACQYPLRTSVDALLVGEHVAMTLPRSVLINAVTLGVSLVIALLMPGEAAQVYAFVGATGVCVVCYVMPVAIHFKLMQQRRALWRQQRCAKQSALGARVSGGGSSGSSGGGSVQEDDPEAALSAPLLTPHSSASSLTDIAALPAAAAPSAASLDAAPGAPSAVRVASEFLDAANLTEPLLQQQEQQPQPQPQQEQEQEQERWLCDTGCGCCSCCPGWMAALGWCARLLPSVLVLCVGLSFSIAALSVALLDFGGD